MTDQTPDRDPEILDAYRRLSDAATSVADPVPGVQRGLRRRRTTRRAVAGVAALAVVGGIGGAVALTAGGGGDDRVAVDEPAASAARATSTLAYERADASAWTFRARTLEVTCTDTGRPGERLVLSTAEPVLAPGVGRALLEPVLRIDLATAGLRLPQTFTLPVPGTSSTSSTTSTPAPVSVFVADPDGRGNAFELSSDQDGTSGTVTVDHASCGATPQLGLRVDAVLGGEVGRPDRALAARFSSGG